MTIAAPQPVFRDGCVHFEISTRVYRLVAVQKTAYRLAAQCTARLDAREDDRLAVALTFPAAVIEAQALEVTRRFFQELLDQELREQIGAETAALRGLLLASAFSRTGLLPTR